jgi:hypothetical protein
MPHPHYGLLSLLGFLLLLDYKVRTGDTVFIMLALFVLQLPMAFDPFNEAKLIGSLEFTTELNLDAYMRHWTPSMNAE